MAWLVAGLGNPGDRYAKSRHNAGRMVAEELARGEGARLKKARFVPAETADIRVGDDRVLVVASTRYMNESGPAYASLAKKHGIEADHVIAVHDELEVPTGELRVKAGGGSGGHNGLKSLTQALRTPEYLRVRVGIGRPPGRQDPADFVLETVGKAQEADLAASVDLAADAVRSLIAEGLAATQDRFNRKTPPG